jgi:hypothetical protein
MLPNAPLWRRLGALIYDSFLLFGLLMLFGGIAVGIESWLFGKTYVETSAQLVAIHCCLLACCLLFVRSIVFFGY